MLHNLIPADFKNDVQPRHKDVEQQKDHVPNVEDFALSVVIASAHVFCNCGIGPGRVIGRDRGSVGVGLASALPVPSSMMSAMG